MSQRFDVIVIGMGPGGEDPRAGPQHRAPQLSELADRRADAHVDVGDQLDLAGVELTLDVAVARAQPGQHGGGGICLAAADRVDEEQFLLDAERERLSAAKLVLERSVGGHDSARASAALPAGQTRRFSSCR